MPVDPESIDQSLLVELFLFTAKTMTTGPTPLEWLTTNIVRCATAASTGATSIKVLQVAGLNAQGEDQLPIVLAGACFLQALKNLQAETSGVAPEDEAAPLSFRFGPYGIPH